MKVNEDVGNVAGLSFRQRRKLGLTAGNVLRTGMRLAKEGKLDRENPDVAASQILEAIVFDNSEAFAEVGPGIDWEKIIEFIEALIPLILMILELFGL